MDNDINAREVSKDDAINFAKSNKLQGFGECSALRNLNVKEIFISFYKYLYKKNMNHLKEKTMKKIKYIRDLQQKQIEKSEKNCCNS